MNNLTTSAHSHLMETLARYGNKIDPSTDGGRLHYEALRSVIGAYSHLAIDRPERMRVAYPLATGIGKTQSVVSWCAAVHRERLDRSALICAEKVNALEEMYEDLLAKGVPSDRVGLFHHKPVNAAKAKTDNEYARLHPCDLADVQDFQFLLVTHAKVKAAKDIDRLNTYGDTDRDLVIWDESLLRHEGRCIVASDVEAALRAGKAKLTGHFANEDRSNDKAAHRCLKYIDKALEQLAREMDKIRHGYDAEPTIIANQPTADEIEEYVDALKRILSTPRSQTDKALRGQLIAFLRLSREKLRLVRLGTGDKGDGMITYLPSVPEQLKRIVILDASFEVRELCRLDQTVTLVDAYERVKRFDNVTVTQVRENGGRSSVSRLRVNSKVTKRVIEDVKAIPAKEAVLIVTYKTRGRRGAIEVLKDALKDAGVNLKARVNALRYSAEHGSYIVTDEPRIQFIHWGMEKAVSKYSYCQHMLAVGVLRRDMLDLSSQVIAQSEDHTSKLAEDRDYLNLVSASEQFYVLQQFIGRGSAREVVNGMAKACNVRVYDQSDFTPFIERGLPGCTWIVEERQKVAPKRDTKTSKLAGKLIEYLQTYTGERLSVRALKIDTGLEDVPNRPFQLARDAALAQLEGWQLQGRSLVRT